MARVCSENSKLKVCSTAIGEKGSDTVQAIKLRLTYFPLVALNRIGRMKLSVVGCLRREIV